MGLCQSINTEQYNRKDSPTILRKAQEPKQQILKIDQQNPLQNSYKYLQKNIFEKTIYDWKSIPLITELDLKNKCYFQVRNRGIKQNNFVVGIIKRSAINLQLSLPWKTKSCLCFQSHDTQGQSGIIFQGNLTKTGKSIKKDQIIRILVSSQEIQFKIDLRTIAKMKIPEQFLNDQILPYVALFEKGDKIQILNQIKFIKKQDIDQQIRSKKSKN